MNNQPEGDKFYNPYHFVPAKGCDVGSVPTTEFLQLQEVVDGQPLPSSVRHLSHNRYLADNEHYFSGRLLCKLTTKTPLVIGAKQTTRANDYTQVQPFKIGDEPAIPASTLRGLISLMVETLADSACRVLDNRHYSYRTAMKDARGAIGMLVEKEIGGQKVLRLRPLTFRPIPLDRHPPKGQEVVPVPAEFQRLADKLVFPVYLDRYDWQQTHGKWTVAERGFLSNRPRSFSSDNRADFWVLPVAADIRQVCVNNAGTWTIVIDKAAMKVRQTENRRGEVTGRTLLGVNAASRGSQPQPLADRGSDGHPDIGILRVLGSLPERATQMPHTKKHELFIPVPDLDYFRHGKKDDDGFDYDLDISEALERFHSLADERTEADGELPFELAGQERVGPPVRKKGSDEKPTETVRLRAGDLVFFRPKFVTEDGRHTLIVESISLSSIWRDDAERAYGYSPAGLLPFRPGQRTTVSTAEQIFGFVPDDHPKAQTAGRDMGDLRGHPADKLNLEASASVRGLASRVRFGMGRFWKAASAVKADLFLPAVPLKILASPKPPCPALYFKDDASRSNYIAKRELASRDPAPRPQGRKFYLHQSIPAGHQPWETKPGADERKDLKLQVQPVRGNVAFVFHLDFENLTKQELGWLCRALKPGEGFLHKLGLGKPLGLGSVEVEPLAIFYVNRKDRYAQQKIFGTQRYHGFQACSSLTEGFVRLLPAKIYGAEMHAVGNCGPTFEELWAAVKPHPDISQALKLLGQPPVGASDQAAPPIQYPATLDMPAEPETDHFQWFVANDDAQHLRERGAWPQQTLAPLTQQSVSLPTLRRLPKKESRQ